MSLFQISFVHPAPLTNGLGIDSSKFFENVIHFNFLRIQYLTNSVRRCMTCVNLGSILFYGYPSNPQARA